MTPLDFLGGILGPGLAWCVAIPAWTIPPDDRATLELLAVSGQESEWRWRLQINGPARGFFQFERGGVHGVMTHPRTSAMALAACVAARIDPNEANAYRFLALNDNLAVAFARLLLWTDPGSLPALTSSDEGWRCYERLWRPGAPRPEAWPAIWEQAHDAMFPSTAA